MINIFLVLLFCVLILYCAFMISVVLLKFKFRSHFFSCIFWLTFLLLLSFFFLNSDHQKAQCYMWFCSTRVKGMESGMQGQIRSHSQCCCLAVQQCLILQRPLGLQPARFLCPWDFPARLLEWVAIFSPGDLADPGTESESPAWQADSLQLRHQGSQGSIFTIHFGKILYALPRSFGNLIYFSLVCLRSQSSFFHSYYY